MRMTQLQLLLLLLLLRMLAGGAAGEAALMDALHGWAEARPAAACQWNKFSSGT
jgi:hypothetical protein